MPFLLPLYIVLFVIIDFGYFSLFECHVLIFALVDVTFDSKK
jgi:hypothetical protein